MSTQPQNGPRFRIPLRTMLIVPFVILIFGTVALVGYLSFRNGQKAVNDVAGQLRNEITARIAEHLSSFLHTPHRINQINAALIRQGVLDSQNQDMMERHFWEQIQIFDSVTSIYFGNPEGGLADAGREVNDNSLYVIFTDGFVSGPFHKYAVDSEGNRTDLLVTVPDFDARTRVWYTGAVEQGDATWSDVYILFTGQDLAIAASRPVYDEDGTLTGVLSVDIFASHLSDFLRELEIGRTGQCFIIERSGLLVASSTDENPFTDPSDEEEQRRLAARDSGEPIMRYAAYAIEDQLGGYDDIDQTEQLAFDIDGQRHFLQVSPFQDDYGIDWLIVVVIPESDFMAQIDANSRATAVLAGIAFSLAIVLGIANAEWIARPIRRLNLAARGLAKGERANNTAKEDWINETRELTLAFNHMVEQLQETLASLQSEIIERRQAEEALRESEERLDLTLKGAELGTWDWNVQTGEVVFNERWAEMLGYSLDEIEPHYGSWEKLLHPDEADEVIGNLSAHLEGETPIYRVEHRLRTKSGGWKWVLTSGKVLMRDEEGHPSRAAGIHHDITESKRAEQALQESHQQLTRALFELEEAQEKMVQQERLASMGQLAAGIAHDFNNILASIVLYSQMSLRSDALSPETREHLEIIAEQADRAANLVQQILDFSRRAVIERRPLNLSVLLEDTVRLLTRTIPESIKIDLAIDEGELLIEADPTRIQQAIINLALNARDAMPEGGRLRIALSRVDEVEIDCVSCGAVATGNWIQVEVSDTGAGIPEDVLPHIFEPFFTTRAPLGHGLGLAQVFGIVKKHQGHLKVSSEEGKGTSFRLYLPPLTEVLAEEVQEVEHEVKCGIGQTILVVEDDMRMRGALVEALNLLGYRVLEATHGQNALEVLEQHSDRTSEDRISLILSDWVMPVMSGLELAYALQKRNVPTKMLMLTGHPLDELTADKTPESIVGWLLKPPTLEKLGEAVAKALRRVEGHSGQLMEA